MQSWRGSRLTQSWGERPVQLKRELGWRMPQWRSSSSRTCPRPKVSAVRKWLEAEGFQAWLLRQVRLASSLSRPLFDTSMLKIVTYIFKNPQRWKCSSFAVGYLLSSNTCYCIPEKFNSAGKLVYRDWDSEWKTNKIALWKPLSRFHSAGKSLLAEFVVLFTIVVSERDHRSNIWEVQFAGQCPGGCGGACPRVHDCLRFRRWQMVLASQHILQKLLVAKAIGSLYAYF